MRKHSKPDDSSNDAGNYSSINRGSPRRVKLRVHLIDNDFKTISVDQDCKFKEILEILSNKIGIEDIDNFGLFEEWTRNGRTEERLLQNDQSLNDLHNKKSEKKLVVKCRVFRELNILNANEATTHLYYIQTKHNILTGYYFAGITNATVLASIQMQIEFGPYSSEKHKLGFMQSRIRDFISTLLLEKHGGKHMEIIILQAYSQSTSVLFT
jgi:hypothetical protein